MENIIIAAGQVKCAAIGRIIKMILIIVLGERVFSIGCTRRNLKLEMYLEILKESCRVPAKPLKKI